MAMRLAGVLALAALAGCARSPSNAVAPSGVTAAATAVGPVTVPFVGCAQDGQTGPTPAPSGLPKMIQATPAVAARLAFYSGDGTVGVLGPSGWHCFGAYGSNGTVLYLAPGPIQSSDVLSDAWAAGSGPAIELAVSDGDTSGRFEVAQAIMRLFPSQQAFAQKVIAEGIDPPSAFPAGPFPTDRMTRRSDTLVDYETPAGEQGLGTTFSRLTANASPIDGAAALQGDTPNFAFLAVRLTPDAQGEAAVIVQQFEADQAVAGHASAPQPAAAPTSGQATALATVQAFYADLGRGDGTSASGLVVPEKRASGPFSAAALTGYYGAMRQPLTLSAATQASPGVVNVSYAFVDANGRACNGRAVVTGSYVGGQWLIGAIKALNGC